MKLTNKHILWIILATAVLLRFWSFWSIPFTHDEFSALFRLKYDSLSELINLGIKEDGHPAGIQLFLYFWSTLFGTSEIALKLPFLLMGTASIYLTYLIGKRLKNESVGLISAAILSGLQYTVMYSQIARPYISGMFFSLCIFLYLLKIAQDGEAKFWKNLVLFSVFGALCAYNHHFSLLQAVLIGLSGFYFLNKKYWLKYTISTLIVFILYAPHLSIFFYQLNKGGVSEWLSQPETSFLWNYIRYIFNYSWLFLIGIGAIYILSIYTGYIKEWRKSIVLFSLFFTPFLIGYFYSIHVEAVLQFSVLIFAFPFLILGICIGLKELDVKFNGVIVIVILALGSLSLVNNRKHYQVFYESIYYLPVEGNTKLKTDAPIILLGDENIYRQTAKKSKRKSKIFVYLSQVNSPKKYIQTLDSIAEKKDEIALTIQDYISPNYLAYAKNYFPNIRYRKNLFLGSYYILNKETPTTEKKISIPMKMENGGYQISSEKEWGPGIELSYADLVKKKRLVMNVNLSIIPGNKLKDLLIVSHVYSKNKKEILWLATNCAKWDNGTGKYHHAIRLSTKIAEDHPEAKIKIFLWNKGRQNVSIKDFNLTITDGNPYLYGLIEDF